MTHIKASTAQISENSAKFLAIPPWGQLCAPRRNQNRIRARLRGEMVKKKMFVLCVMWMPGACSQVWGTAKIGWKIRRISKKSPKSDAGLEKHPWEG